MPSSVATIKQPSARAHRLWILQASWFCDFHLEAFYFTPFALRLAPRYDGLANKCYLVKFELSQSCPAADPHEFVECYFCAAAMRLNFKTIRPLSGAGVKIDSSQITRAPYCILDDCLARRVPFAELL